MIGGAFEPHPFLTSPLSPLRGRGMLADEPDSLSWVSFQIVLLNLTPIPSPRERDVG